MHTTPIDAAQRLREGLGRVVVGGDRVAHALLVALLAGGHALLEGVPGYDRCRIVECNCVARNCEETVNNDDIPTGVCYSPEICWFLCQGVSECLAEMYSPDWKLWLKSAPSAPLVI